jgi:hypothetical protein
MGGQVVAPTPVPALDDALREQPRVDLDDERPTEIVEGPDGEAGI